MWLATEGSSRLLVAATQMLLFSWQTRHTELHVGWAWMGWLLLRGRCPHVVPWLVSAALLRGSLGFRGEGGRVGRGAQ